MRLMQPTAPPYRRATWFVIIVCASFAFAAAPQRSSIVAAAESHGISIAGAVEHPRTLTLDDLMHEPAVTQAVTLKTGKGTLSGRFTGVSLWSLLQQAGLKSTGGKNDVMHHTVIVTGNDGYTTVLSAAELDPEFGDEQALLAYAKDGKPLAGPGFARLILPADKSAGRAVRGVIRIEVQ